MDRTRRHLGFAAAVLLAVLAAAGCGGSPATGTSSVAGGQTSQSRSSGTIVGAGSTLVAPLVSAWQSDYAKAHGVQVGYGAIGSGGGIAQISARTVDFGASDAPLTPDQKTGCRGCVMVPWALAATTVALNVPGVTGHLKLTGPLLADICLGKVTTWNDPAIRRLNPGLKLPAQKIAPIYRSDASGDTYAFTDYLSHVSPAFKAKLGGASTQVSWPVGTGAKGNAGVAASVEQTPGAIAYVAIAQAEGSHLNVALIRNRAGRYPLPEPATFAAAAAGARLRPDGSVSIVDPPGPDAYPIATFTYAIVSRSSPKLAELKRFLDYAITSGQKIAPRLAFAPLPKVVVAKDEAIVKAL